MNEKSKIKAHFQENWKLYAGVGIGVIFAGITCLIVKGRYEALANSGAYGPETADTSVTMRPFSFLSHQENIVHVSHSNGVGRPGYLVHNLDTDKYFSSQRDAATYFGISETILSKHLSGKIPNAEGLMFERNLLH